MLLEVPPGDAFDATGHEPILAGIDNESVEEYLATVCIDPSGPVDYPLDRDVAEDRRPVMIDFNAPIPEDMDEDEDNFTQYEAELARQVCTVREGDSVAEYWNSIDGGCIRKTSRFWVLVLRCDVVGGAGNVSHMNWVDVTGECRWESI
jgi:hypothetical protein